MTDLAAISAQLVDMRNVGSQKSLRLTLHVPEELALKAIEAFGWPTGANPVPVALARLTMEAAAQKPPPPIPDHDKEGARRLYARIGTLCKDPKFWEYVAEHTGVVSINGEKGAAEYVRDFCQVVSRRDIVAGSIAEELFLHHEDDFEIWRMAPDLARRG